MLISMLSSGDVCGEVCAVFALSACACGGGYQYCRRREGDECRDEACRRAGCSSVSHFSCRLLLAPCRIPFFFSSYRYEFPASSVMLWRLVSYSPVLQGVMPDLEIRAAVFSVSLRLISSSRLVSAYRRIVLSRLDTSRRFVSSHRFVLSRHVRRYASLDTGGGKGVSFNYSYGRRFLIPYDFSIRRRYGGISVLPRFPIYHDTLYCVNFLYYDMHIRFRTGSPNRLSGTRS